MKTLYDDNFLNGQLWLEIDDDGSVYGEFKFYDFLLDDIFTLVAKAGCHPDDKYSEKKGMELVKSKIAREYHKIYMNTEAAEIRLLKELLKWHEQEYEFRKKKVLNIEKDLSEHYGLTYYRRNPKKKKTTKNKKK